MAMDIYKKMKELIKKILREDEFQWMRDIKPNFFEVLGYITKDDPRINVVYNEGEGFYEITDEWNIKYYDYYDMENFLHRFDYDSLIDPHDIKETKRILLHYIEVIPGDIGEKDYDDFMHLYQVISDNF
jgi:hypothetical protein